MQNRDPLKNGRGQLWQSNSPMSHHELKAFVLAVAEYCVPEYIGQRESRERGETAAEQFHRRAREAADARQAAEREAAAKAEAEKAKTHAWYRVRSGPARGLPVLVKHGFRPSWWAEDLLGTFDATEVEPYGGPNHDALAGERNGMLHEAEQGQRYLELSKALHRARSPAMVG